MQVHGYMTDKCKHWLMTLNFLLLLLMVSLLSYSSSWSLFVWPWLMITPFFQSLVTWLQISYSLQFLFLHALESNMSNIINLPKLVRYLCHQFSVFCPHNLLHIHTTAVAAAHTAHTSTTPRWSRGHFGLAACDYIIYSQ